MNSVHHHPDRRSPYVFDVLELGRRPGAMKEIRVDVPAPADLGYDVISVPQGSGVDLDLKLEAVVEGVLVTGTARAQVRGECARCLSPIEDEKSFGLQELYFYPGNEVDEDESVVVDDAIDLEELERILTVAPGTKARSRVASVRSKVTNLRPTLPLGYTITDFQTLILDELRGREEELVPVVLDDEAEEYIQRKRAEQFEHPDWIHSSIGKAKES